MPEYLAPGVYVEEISTGPRPIEGVGTSTLGMVGQTERGPVLPRLVTSWEEYVRWYGTYVDRVPGGTQLIYLPYAVRGFFDNAGQRLIVARVTGPAAGTASVALGGGSATAIGPGAWGNNILLRITPASLAGATGPTATWFRLTLLYYRDGIPTSFVDPTDPNNFGNPNRREPDVIEDYDNLSDVPTEASFAQSVVNPASKLVNLVVSGRPADAAFPSLVLTGGTNVEPTLAEYQGDPADPIERRRGLLGLAGIDDIALLAVPDEVDPNIEQIRTDAIQQCERLKDRFFISSATLTEQDSNITTLRPPIDTTYAAYYLPWVRVSAPHTAEGNILVPPTGHIGGIYARVDTERGVHKAPANEVVRGIINRDLGGDQKPLRYILNKQQQDFLNPKGVNVIRDFRADGRGIRVWGARTQSSDGMWKYINVRRLFIFVEESIDQGTQWAVFEPNYEQTWSAIRLSVSAFLRTVWRNGALAGVTEDEAFFVKCDRTTMTQDDWDNGRLICLIGIAPVKPAEFVIFRISQKTVEATQQ
jgi:phage tail sheath protein FI